MSNKLRRVLKSITWRITASFTTVSIVYFLTGEMEIAGSVASLEIIAKILIYYLHETAWDRVKDSEESISDKNISKKSMSDKNIGERA
ncbi:DUF2061 domain-containing protein [Selenihalanaerobacter shriftii]|uniref:Uncharacterized membrane protein n=1 Tax=Selenihalanaerobacter shriftii TaxID=142842 RepID=A0A1T4JUQ6_9FIRM|nr:DUF2061 domain-containing protein [Selenihalanaerobacter shriftii]SJZ33962.1 Uncharacterized membrane protein [Selenihalanaerobacter shriftii]